MSEIKNKMVG